MKANILNTMLMLTTLATGSAFSDVNLICNSTNPLLKIVTDKTTVADSGYAGVFIPVKSECSEDKVCEYQVSITGNDEAIQPVAYNHNAQTSWMNNSLLSVGQSSYLYAFTHDDAAGQCIFKNDSGTVIKGDLVVTIDNLRNTDQPAQYWQNQGIVFN